MDAAINPEKRPVSNASFDPGAINILEIIHNESDP